MEEITVSKYVQLKGPKNQTGYCTKNLGMSPDPLLLTMPTIMCGIELEMENAGGLESRQFFYENSTVVGVKEDSSLRNNGREVVTAPINNTLVVPLLRKIFQFLPSEIEFSKRTSTHVHFNVLDFTGSQLECLLYLYILFEDALFDVVRPERKESIFCVPVGDTDVYHTICAETIGVYKYWDKYCALNLKTVPSYGTVEFRHMHGTPDVEEVIKWFYTINALVSYAKTYERPSTELLKEICQLNSNSLYLAFTNKVFGKFTDNLNLACLEKGMERGVKALKQVKRSTTALTMSLYPTSVIMKSIAGDSFKPKSRVFDYDFIHNQIQQLSSTTTTMPSVLESLSLDFNTEDSSQDQEPEF